MTLEMGLELEGYRVSSFERGEDALPFIAFQTKPVDVVLLDLCTDGIAADDFMRRLNATLGTARPPVVLLSAFDNLKQECKNVGADSYLQKPFEHEVLLKTIRNAASGLTAGFRQTSSSAELTA